MRDAHPPRLTPAELRALLARHGLSQVAAARATGVSPRAMRHYLHGDRPVPLWLPLAILAVVQRPGD